MTTKISFVIPCYNSEQIICSVVDEITSTLKQKQQEYSYEIVLINDSSKDNTLETILQLAKKNKQIKVINLSKNFGQHAAIMAGFHFISGDIIICMDDDGQTPANEAFKLIGAISDETDVVFASYQQKQHSCFRNIGSKINDVMASYLLGKPKELQLSSYFACKKFLIDEIIKYENPYPYISGLILRSTKNIINVDINHRQREIGKSNYSFLKLIQLWSNGFTAFSVKPLRLATFFGFIFAFFGFIFIVLTIINKISNPNAIIGYTSLMSALLFIGGILMIMLGLIGEYLGRIYISLNKSPQFIIKNKINF